MAKLKTYLEMDLKEFAKALQAALALPSPTGSGTGRMVDDVVPPPPAEERPGIDYYTAQMLYWGLDRAARLKWTSRGDSELRAIMNAEADLDDKKMTRFYLNGVEWKP
jgi:hypothetical protein